MTEDRSIKTKYKTWDSVENAYKCQGCGGCIKNKFGESSTQKVRDSTSSLKLQYNEACIINCGVCVKKKASGFDERVTQTNLSEVFCKNRNCNIAKINKNRSSDDDFSATNICCHGAESLNEACPLGKCGYLSEGTDQHAISQTQLEKCPVGGFCASRVKIPPREYRKIYPPNMDSRSRQSTDSSGRSRSKRRQPCDPKYFEGLPGGFKEMKLYNCASRHGSEMIHTTDYSLSTLRDSCSKPKCNKRCKRQKAIAKAMKAKKPCGQKECQWVNPQPVPCGRKSCTLKPEKPKKKKKEKVKSDNWSDVESLRSRYKNMVVYSDKPVFGCGQEQCVLKKTIFGGKKKCVLYRYPVLAVCPVCNGLSVTGEVCDPVPDYTEPGRFVNCIKKAFSKTKRIKKPSLFLRKKKSDGDDKTVEITS